MILQVQAGLLAQALTRVLPTTRPKHQLPAMTCVLIEPCPNDTNRILLRTSTFDRGSRTSVAAFRPDPMELTTAPAQLLQNLAALFPVGQTLHIEPHPIRCIVRTATAEYQLLGSHAHEFPAFPETDSPLAQALLTPSKLPPLPREKSKRPTFVGLHRLCPTMPTSWLHCEDYELLLRDLKHASHARLTLLHSMQLVWKTTSVERHVQLHAEPKT